MKRIAVVVHNPEVGPDRLEPFLAGHDVTRVDPRSGSFPEGVEAAVVLGGVMAAFEDAENPWLIEERRWISSLVTDDVPVLGICLGSQLLAHSLGGRAFRADRPEVGVIEVNLTPAGSAHPVTRHLGESVFLSHQDTFEVPAGATLLAATDRFPTAFTLGSALALQSHPEVTVEIAKRWTEDPDFDLPERAGVTPTALHSQLDSHRSALESNADEMFDAWFRALGV